MNQEFNLRKKQDQNTNDQIDTYIKEIRNLFDQDQTKIRDYSDKLLQHIESRFKILRNEFLNEKNLRDDNAE